MIAERRWTLAVIAFATLLAAFETFGRGAGLRVAPAEFDVARLDQAAGAAFGPFVVLDVEPRAGQALRLRSANCAQPLFLRVVPIADPTPDELVAVLYPAAQWRALTIYRGKPVRSFARLAALVGHRLRNVMSDLDLAEREASDVVTFVFHSPIDCPLDPASAIAAADAAAVFAGSPPSRRGT